MKQELRRLWNSVAPEKTLVLVGSSGVLHVREQFRGAELKRSSLQDSSWAGRMLLLSTGGESPPKKTTGLQILTLLPAGVFWGVPCMCPWGLLLHFPTKPRARTPSSPSPRRCQLKPSSSPGGPQLMLSTARLGRVPALFTSFFPLLLVLPLLSHPLGLLRKELPGAALPREAGCP